MRRKYIKTKCEKRKVEKCTEVCKTYDKVQYAAADFLNSLQCVKEIRCNVWLEGLGLELEYTSDFVCIKDDGDIMVRECVFRKHLSKPMTLRLLEASRRYWVNRGVKDWGIIIDAKK